MNKKQIKEECIKIFNLIVSNSFLFPVGCNDNIDFYEIEGHYRTYFNEDRDYFSIDITEEDRKVFTINIRKIDGEYHFSVSACDCLFDDISTNKKIEMVYKYLVAIYNQVFSLKVDDAEFKKIKNQIKETKKVMMEKEKELDLLKKRLSDYKLEILNH